MFLSYSFSKVWNTNMTFDLDLITWISLETNIASRTIYLPLWKLLKPTVFRTSWVIFCKILGYTGMLTYIHTDRHIYLTFVLCACLWKAFPRLFVRFFLKFWQKIWISKIEKVPRGIRGEKSSKDMTSSRNLVSTRGALASPKIGWRNQVSGRVSVPCLHATPVANAPWKPLVIRSRSKSVSRSITRQTINLTKRN